MTLLERATLFSDLTVKSIPAETGSGSPHENPAKRVDPSRVLELAFGHQTADRDLVERVRAAQISGVLRMTPFAVIANAVAGLATVFALAGSVAAPVLAVWALAIGYLMMRGARAWWIALRNPIRSASKRAMQRAVQHATILSALWALVPLAAFGLAEKQPALLVACLMTGMICAGGFALSTLPKAALYWVAILTLGSLLALFLQPEPQVWPMVALLFTYSAIVALCSVSTGWLFVAHFVGEFEVGKRGELISLLLNEFQETASDWLWETDQSGFFKRISKRFLQVSGRHSNELQAQRIGDLARSVKTHEAQRAALALDKAMAAKEGFRDVVIEVDVDGDQRYWSVSGRPFFNDQGRFCGYRGVGSDVTDSTRSAALVAHLAVHDSLTGVGNRSWFLQRLHEHLARRTDGDGKHTALMLIDLDNFKVVNDTCGQPAGDRLLRYVAERFKAVGGGRAELARFGGDEFAVLADFAKPGQAQLFAERLIEVAQEPFELQCRSFSLSATVGFALSPDHGQTVDDLLRNADIALYEAKRIDRGGALSYKPHMEREVRSRREIENDLRLALAEEALRLEFQPIIDARTGEVVSSEVLVRWYHPVRGEIPPSQFVPIAEEAGLMLSLGSWVLKRACETAARYPDLKSVAVNLSPMQFMSANLPELVRNALMETGFDAGRLVLEVTESVLIRDADAARDMLTSLRDLGVRIALDDFGTGYSSLSYLRQYRFDKIKIDKCFVDEIGITSDGLAIIAAVIALAHNLGLEVTAEGVEKKFQAEALRTLGCDSLQGFYFGRPQPEPVMTVDPKLIEAISRTPPVKLAGFGS
ncbi:putative bifunctional diguanylate cyclase/phosphodiesterase [Roseibium aquae]|nr:EAL domain-containing protein [Roseibium aquae]